MEELSAVSEPTTDTGHKLKPTPLSESPTPEELALRREARHLLSNARAFRVSDLRLAVMRLGIGDGDGIEVIRQRQQDRERMFEPNAVTGLCKDCMHAHIIQRPTGEPDVICNALGENGARVPPDVERCNRFTRVSRSREKTVGEYEEEALLVGPREGAWEFKEGIPEDLAVLRRALKDEKERRYGYGNYL